MNKQEFWQTPHGKELALAYRAAKAEYQAAIDHPEEAPAPISTYHKAFALVCLEIGNALVYIDKRMSGYYLKLASNYGVK